MIRRYLAVIGLCLVTIVLVVQNADAIDGKPEKESCK